MGVTHLAAESDGDNTVVCSLLDLAPALAEPDLDGDLNFAVVPEGCRGSVQSAVVSSLRGSGSSNPSSAAVCVRISGAGWVGFGSIRPFDRLAFRVLRMCRAAAKQAQRRLASATIEMTKRTRTV